MLAVYASAVGGDDPLANLAVGDLPTPVPRPGWALVRVRAASLNHHDIWTLRGVSSGPVTPPQILGCDAAGEVAAYGGEPPPGAPEVGARVVVYPIITCGQCAACLGDDTLGCRAFRMLSEAPLAGALAEYVEIPVTNLVTLADQVSFADAACLPTAYLTAYRALFVRAGLRPGMSVLVQGASGGVATACILLGRLAGITVYATSRDEAKRALAVDLGAEAAFPVERETARAVVGATGGIGVDAVVDTVGEPTWDLSLRAVRPGGVIVVPGATAGANPPAQLNRIFFRSVSIAGTTMGTRGELRRLVDLTATGALRPLIGSTHRLSEAPAAFAEMAAGDLRGKIVLEA
ncbi:MAG: zinc-binding dehydrogenase [Candidatus Dormibacteria bacterium]